jgi:hypothetical protein
MLSPSDSESCFRMDTAHPYSSQGRLSIALEVRAKVSLKTLSTSPLPLRRYSQLVDWNLLSKALTIQTMQQRHDTPMSVLFTLHVDSFLNCRH